MDHLTPPEFVTRDDGVRLAYCHVTGRGPTLVFLPGYMSDMRGGKAQAIAAWAEREGRAILRLDYSGCGESSGRFEDGTLDLWRDDALCVIDAVAPGALIVIGSSMGGWIALLIAELRRSQMAGLVGIASAPDFTRWGFTDAEKTEIESAGALARPSDYAPDQMITTRAFWQSGESNLMLHRNIAIACPVRLIHGQNDQDVPWSVSLDIAARLRSADVQSILIKDGDHRLSRDADLAAIVAIIARLTETS